MLISILLAGSACAQSTVSISPSSFDFGDVEQFTSSPSLPVTITNLGTTDLVISQLSFSDADDFAEFDSCSASPIPPNQSCELDVVFAPIGLGNLASVLTIQSNAPDGPFTVNLAGYGTSPASNDAIGNAIMLAPTDHLTFTTKNATGSASDPRPAGCENGNDSRNHTVWFRFVPPADGWLQIDTAGSDFDSVASVWSGDPASLVLNACDDDEAPGTIHTSKLAVAVSAASTYYVMVSGRAVSDQGILSFQSNFQTTAAIKQGEKTAASVSPGQSAAFTTLVEFPGDTTLSAAISGESATIHCTVNPSALQFLGSGGSRFALVNVDCSTTGPVSGLISPRTNNEILFAGAIFIFAFPFLKWNRKLAALLLCGILMCSCGGGSSKLVSSAPPPPVPTGPQASGTPKGTYTVTLTGNPQPVTSTPMVLTVQ